MNDMREMLEGVTGATVTGGNAIDVFRNGEEIFPAMLETIRSAEHTIELLTYVYWTGDIAERVAHALADRSAAGVKVRVVLDAVGCFPMPDHLVEVMEDAGCHVEMFRKVDERPTRLQHRTHRKLLITDETVAMTGGVGIAREWEGNARNPDEWRDTHFRIRGPAVRRLRSGFVEHWVECGHPSWGPDDRFPPLSSEGEAEAMVLRGSSGPFWHEIGLATDALLRAASARIRITTAYFAPGERMIELLADAVQRGVDVDILLPGSHMDKRVVQLASNDEYERLLEAGVRIFHYEQTMLHTKSVTVDGWISLIGSANIDERSMRHNEEIALVVFDQDLCELLDDHFDEDLEVSEAIDLERWQDRPLWRQAIEKLVDPVEHLL